MHGCLAAVLTLALAAAAEAGQAPDPSSVGSRLLADPSVRAALEAVRAGEPRVLADQARLCEIPAPTFHEEARAAAVKALFEEQGLRNVRVDAIGNVLGERPGKGARPHLLFGSHLDTVFPAGTDLAVKREGSLLKGPGIGDNCRGLATMLGVIRALREAKLETPGTITFVANVREEGRGNLEGVRHLFEGELKGRVDAFVAIDGSGTGFTYDGVGTQRYRVTFKGRGGHSYYAFGIANPMHALGRAIARIADIRTPGPGTTFSVGLVGGGTSVNSIAAAAWMELDMRSREAAPLQALVEQVKQAVADATAAENERWGGRGPVVAEWEDIGAAPPGSMADDSPIVQAARSVTTAVGLSVFKFPSTTDSNVPMSLGIPAITLDGGGGGSGGHSLGEFFETKDSWKGTQRALLLALALVQG